jgi:exopolysaccharide biosynthesis polyprenyl glycosylphosphotransferase
MKRSLSTAASLLVLDAVAVLAVFNLVNRAWLHHVAYATHWVGLPLLGPYTLVVTGFYLIDGYRRRTDMLSVDYTSEHLISLLTGMMATLLLTFVFFPEGYTLQQSRFVVAGSFLVLMPVTLSYRRTFYAARLRTRRVHSLVYVGDAAHCAEFASECMRLGLVQPVIYASLTGLTAPPFPGLPLVPFEEVLTKIETGEMEVEALVLRESNRELKAELSQRLTQLYFHGVPTYTLELFHQIYWRKIPLYRLNQTWLFQEGFQIAREPVFERIKRLSDIVLASVGLLVALPLLAVAALLVWFEDRGPVFFLQTRIGRNHEPFQIIKLRTMRVNSGGARYTQKDDQRITRIGRFLRASRLDEFPQLINVLRGEMSMIGPRAEWDVLVRDYEAKIPCYHFRHLVKPGITGWAQVNYPYGANLDDTLRKLEYDLYYIRHFSFLLDAAIVLKTIHIMVFGKGR